MDANNPTQFGVFEKKWSKKNQYDRFSALLTRSIAKEYQGVVIPDYLNITYSCTIFTEYVEQMNGLVESINYASDAYWGDPDKFNFRAMIDDYQTITELVQGQDRSVKTNFSIKLLGHVVPNAENTLPLLGHVVPNAENTLPQGNAKFFNKASVLFGVETVVDINNLPES